MAFLRPHEVVTDTLRRRIGGDPQILEETAVDVVEDLIKAGYDLKGIYRDRSD